MKMDDSGGVNHEISDNTDMDDKSDKANDY